MKVQPRTDDPARGKLVVECKHTTEGECKFSLWRGPAGGAMWHWDGNVEKPTISPSIDCKGGCGRHFTVIAGEPR
jgi:hypothetical protein